MQFSKSMLFIGEGRLSGAVARDGRYEFYLDSDGAIVKKSMPEGRRVVSKGEIISYADDYTETEQASVTLFGNEIEITPII